MPVTFYQPINTGFSSYNTIASPNIGCLQNILGTAVVKPTSGVTLNTITFINSGSGVSLKGLYLITCHIKIVCSSGGSIIPGFELVPDVNPQLYTSVYGTSIQMPKITLANTEFIETSFTTVMPLNATTFGVSYIIFNLITNTTYPSGNYSITGTISSVKIL